MFPSFIEFTSNTGTRVIINRFYLTHAHVFPGSTKLHFNTIDNGWSEYDLPTIELANSVLSQLKNG